ncbi:cobalamin synthase [Aeromicrobium sp. Root495]|uniref:adenosylcobinamide-GDP ribazoletransferase n=1 Tax=Aeromicrobium sp. Root495 TaxID=1736550 RepID=UPI0006F88D38|nr:adenosylcobinamide-GDP ribazoletransferase [Aeromicrobium sp. Root495]KQY60467.1 cobalamin synthase [Aeromicrobium sp. Root495]
MTLLLDAWRLSVGTLTALRVAPPTTVDRRVGGLAMLLAPLAVLPLGAVAGGLAWAGLEWGLAPFAVAVVVVASVVLGTRAFHVDGLADTADGLTASYDRERALAVMKTGDVGPAGAAAVVLVLLAQVGSVAWLLSCSYASSTAEVGLAVGLAVLASRSVLAVACTSGIPSARPGGLGDTVVGSVPVAGALLAALVGVGLLSASGALLGLEWWRGAAAAAAAAVVVGALVRRCASRLGGITGDVLGASVELTLAVTLIALT